MPAIASDSATISLIRKDLRLLRPTLVGATLAVVLFSVVLPLIDFPWNMIGLVGVYRAQNLWHLASDIRRGLTLLWLMGPVMFAIVGGSAFALERRERWSDFIALMPESRSRSVAIKLMISLIACLGYVAIIYSLSVAATWLTFLSNYIHPHSDAFVLHWPSFPYLPNFQVTAGVSIAAGVGLFGVGWLLSTILRSPVLAVAISLGLGGSLYSPLIDSLNHYITDPNGSVFRSVEIIAITVGVLSVAAGTVIQTRRLSP